MSPLWYSEVSSVRKMSNWSINYHIGEDIGVTWGLIGDLTRNGRDLSQGRIRYNNTYYDVSKTALDDGGIKDRSIYKSESK